nr:hypothetical protein BaRGS_016263 [Batillaria attramentaria]
MEYEDEGVLAKILPQQRRRHHHRHQQRQHNHRRLLQLQFHHLALLLMKKNRGWLMDHLKTGPKGSMLKGDVLGYLKAKGLPKPAIKFKLQAAQKEAEDSKGQPRWHDMPLSTMRKTIAKRLTESKGFVLDLAKRAREGKLKPEQYQGGTFTISNLGMYGIKEFSAIINLPQIAIMAVGGAHASVGENNAFEHKMTATLSFDCRAIDETEATRFLEAFRSALENPDLMMADIQIDRQDQC